MSSLSKAILCVDKAQPRRFEAKTRNRTKVLTLTNRGTTNCSRQKGKEHVKNLSFSERGFRLISASKSALLTRVTVTATCYGFVSIITGRKRTLFIAPRTAVLRYQLYFTGETGHVFRWQYVSMSVDKCGQCTRDVLEIGVSTCVIQGDCLSQCRRAGEMLNCQRDFLREMIINGKEVFVRQFKLF